MLGNGYSFFRSEKGFYLSNFNFSAIVQKKMFALVKMKLQAAGIRFAMHFPATLSGEQVHGLENEIPLTQQDS